MAGNVANHGYLCALILKELAANRSVEVTGSLLATIKTRADYETRKYRLIGKFGEVVARNKDGVALIATREMPEWACLLVHEKIWDCDEMLRWKVSVEER
jgi:hypothetical protein